MQEDFGWFLMDIFRKDILRLDYHSKQKLQIDKKTFSSTIAKFIVDGYRIVVFTGVLYPVLHIRLMKFISNILVEWAQRLRMVDPYREMKRESVNYKADFHVYRRPIENYKEL